jgi:hypothetical protein
MTSRSPFNSPEISSTDFSLKGASFLANSRQKFSSGNAASLTSLKPKLPEEPAILWEILQMLSTFAFACCSGISTVKAATRSDISVSQLASSRRYSSRTSRKIFSISSLSATMTHYLSRNMLTGIVPHFWGQTRQGSEIFTGVKTG